MPKLYFIDLIIEIQNICCPTISGQRESQLVVHSKTDRFYFFLLFSNFGASKMETDVGDEAKPVNQKTQLYIVCIILYCTIPSPHC